jgi:hypothetical protein
MAKQLLGWFRRNQRTIALGFCGAYWLAVAVYFAR